MSDVTRLLAKAADPVPADPSTVDTDVQRARRALRRHRLRRAATPALTLAVLATLAVGGILGMSPGPAPGGPAGEAAEDHGGGVAADEAITLVAFTGDQPSGYSVERVPDGWEVEDANPAYMLIAPVGGVDNPPGQDFVGKLLVMLRSDTFQNDDPVGEPVPVGEDTGWLRDSGSGSTTLTYRDAGGLWVEVQVPPELGWSAAELGDFAAGVQVTDDAAPSRG